MGIQERVHFLGAVSQERLPNLYRRATLFIAPFVEAASGDQEGLGLVTVEAIACGCPAIVGDVPGTREIDVIRIPPGDSPAMTERIIQLLALSIQERAVLGAAQRRSIQVFDWKMVVTGYRAALQKAAERAPV